MFSSASPPSLSTCVFLHEQGLHHANPGLFPRWGQEKSRGQQNEAFSVPWVWVSTGGARRRDLVTHPSEGLLAGKGQSDSVLKALF